VETNLTETTGPNDLKEKRDSATRRSLRENLQQEAGSSGAPLRGPVTTSEPAADISAKGRDEPVVRNLPEVKPGTSLLGVSGTDTPLQGAYLLTCSRRRNGTPSLWGRWNPSGEEGIVWMRSTETEIG
jgi:hypothetical protein